MNDFGVGERTETISATTLGSAPIPPDADRLITVNSTSISLRLGAWETGGCSISSFVVEYRLRGKPSGGNGGDWVLVNNNVKLNGGGGGGRRDAASSEFAILDLSPETMYTLRITAHNAAGSTVQKYDFTTLTYLGGWFLVPSSITRSSQYCLATIAPELIIHSDYGGLIFKNPAVMLPLFLAIVIMVIVAILFVHHWRKKAHHIGTDSMTHARNLL